MKEKIIISDFDGTITKKDTLYHFFKEHASNGWMTVEKLWKERKIGSKECLIREFELVENLSEKLIDKFIDTLELDCYFKDFIKISKEKNVDFIIVSDGIDYFINRVLEKNNIKNLKIISNTGKFYDDGFEITCPFEFSGCKVNSGTCKCKVVENLRDEYKELIYIGDGTSDFCVAENVGINKLFAKDSLFDFCTNKKIDCVKYNTFKDIANIIFQ